jgi:cytochrome c biogenesis protein CcmG, thiol:disulfide interchange protein DsbE
MTGMRPRRLLAAAALLLAATAACGGEPGAKPDAEQDGETTGVVSPLADCETLAVSPQAAPGVSGDVDRLPALTLPCFTGGAPVELSELAGPAVINLWASWCRPCRQELPVLQRYADQMDGRVQVVGVVTQDTRARAAAFAEGAGIAFPALYDRDGELLVAAGIFSLPVTLFVDGDGQIRHVHNRELDEETLRRHADELVGVGQP